jgi:hypothetical protein
LRAGEKRTRERGRENKKKKEEKGEKTTPRKREREREREREGDHNSYYLERGGPILASLLEREKGREFCA